MTMTKAGEQPTITQADHEVIYLAPKCFGVERSWCKDAGVEDCDCIDGPHDWIKFTRTSLAAQDGLDDHFPSGLRQKRYEIATAGDVVDGPVCVDCHCGASFNATDEGEARQLWASHARAAMERPKTAAQDGLVEALEKVRKCAVVVPSIFPDTPPSVSWIVSELTKILPEMDAALSAIKGDKS